MFGLGVARTVSKQKNGNWFFLIYPYGREGRLIRRHFNFIVEA
ncbi:site-specific integrase, partial [Salmonella enterica subsp. enterica serovar Weltevreden]|nr:site-specific integrase [Salmonella enterica subsp. enterica serovar Weltevreden]